MKKAQKIQLSKLTREYIIKRDKVCLKCGKGQNLHASHIYPRGKYPKMQFDTKNIKALCLGCHLYWWHKHPIEAREWAEKALGKDRLRYLKKRANTIDKTLWDFKEIKIEIEKKIRKLDG